MFKKKRVVDPNEPDYDDTGKGNKNDPNEPDEDDKKSVDTRGKMLKHMNETEKLHKTISGRKKLRMF